MASPRTSVASSQPEQRHIRIIAAAAQANETRVQDILTEETTWSSSADRDALRQALQKVAGRGKLSIVRLLIQHGADVDPKPDAEVPAIVKAAEAGNAAVVSELLAHRATANARNRLGQTALFCASIRGHDRVIEVLLNGGADTNAKDKEGRSTLLYLASEKQSKVRWTLETLRLLLLGGADIEVRDHIGRTPLLWAATNANIELAKFLLENGADVAATNNRGRTALHLSAESNDKEHRDGMVKLLLDHGAHPGATSDGGWTPLHNAAQNGHLSVAILLLEKNANVNAELSNGMTPLHWAAFNGFEDFVRLLLSRPDVNTSVKDSFDRTPMLCAAEKRHANIVWLLSPASTSNRLSPLEERACKAFEATVVDFGHFEKKQLVSKYSVYDLLYGWNDEIDKPQVSTLTKNIHYKPDFRWIHLPANNIAWVETLLAKSFIEAGYQDIESFKALEKCFDQEHRGQFPHAHFMRTFCHRIQSPRRDGTGRPNANPSQDDNAATTRNSPEAQDTGTSETEAKNKKKNKAEQIAERHPKKHGRGKGPPGNPPQVQDNTTSGGSKKVQVSLPWDTSQHGASHGKIVLFMPFLHYETDERRQEMSRAISCVHEKTQQIDTLKKDALLINAYLENTPSLHPRRTLDQFYYHGIDTSARDRDQVVYRFCEKYKIEKKVFMVDQLWLWVIGKDLVITCFPQRWDQPKNDPLNVLEGIIEETNAKTRPPIQSVYDLAMLITGRCSGMFDRSRFDDQNYQFLDMFENSIGSITDKESRLFSRFNRASDQSARWLQHHRRRRTSRSLQIESSDTDFQYKDRDGADQFPDALLDIVGETSLLAEIKDIRDELGIIVGILEAQLQTINYLEGFMTEELRDKSSRRNAEGVVSEIRRRTGQQRRDLDVKLKDVNRMDRQAESLYNSLTDLLDLKQKHSNALEARFAGDQALIAAKQGQTIMVFTIVTIIFLPLSFIASFFAINFPEWEQSRPLSIPFVSKYLFGIGLAVSVPLIALAFTVQNISNGVSNLFSNAREMLGQSTSHDKWGRVRAREDKCNADDPTTDLTAITRGKPDYPRLSLSIRREDYYRPPPSRPGEFNGNTMSSSNAWMRPRLHSYKRSDEYYRHGRLSSPVSAAEQHKMTGLGSRNCNNITWAAQPTLARGAGSGARTDELNEDLESGRFRQKSS
ncbi:hypothetical protein GGS21DRAFT_488139 [Xylaria nigripes]|nr:hypothetical protein GGS21DRAFT_488139 [Xylaria nigripes]